MKNDKITMNNLKKIVKTQNKSLLSIAIELGVSQEALSQYINGKINPKLSNIVKLSKMLNTTTDYLLDLTDNPIKPNINLTENEFTLLNNYKKLNKTEQLMVNSYIQALIDIK